MSDRLLHLLGDCWLLMNSVVVVFGLGAIGFAFLLFRSRVIVSANGFSLFVDWSGSSFSRFCCRSWIVEKRLAFLSLRFLIQSWRD